MEEEELPQTNANPDDSTSDDSQELSDEELKDPTKTKEYIKKLRSKDANKRLQLKELKAKAEELDTLKAQQQAEVEEQAKKRGEYEKLYTETKAKLEAQDARIKELEAIETQVNAELETKVKALPSAIQELMPENLTTAQKLAWVNKATKAKLGTDTSNNGTEQGNTKGAKSSNITSKEKTLEKATSAIANDSTYVAY